MKKNNKGFTLAELLIVVAIIAVLIAIAIPIFTTQLEKARENTDLANIRAAYAAGTVYAMTTTDTSLTDKYYNPGVDGSLDGTSGVALGQGTEKDGKADCTAVAGYSDYKNNTPAKGKQIKITFAEGAVKSGTGIQFVAAA